MQPSPPAPPPLAALVCPACRTRTADRIDVRTLHPHPTDPSLLQCDCGREYPIIDGVPIVLSDPDAFYRDAIAQIVERDLSPTIAAQLAAAGPDDAPYARLIEHLSIYLDAHWGDRATPPPDGPGATTSSRHAAPATAAPSAVTSAAPLLGAAAPPPGPLPGAPTPNIDAAGTSGPLAALVARISARPHVPLSVELGCSTGRIVAELARTSDHAVGLELHFGAIRRARALLSGATLPYARRRVGRHYASAAIVPGDRALAAHRYSLVCGDALDPPLIPRAFDRVVALNLLDSVANPAQLLSVIDGLCATNGEIILASPYAWQSGITAPHHQLGGADPAAFLVQQLRTGANLEAAYAIEDEADLPWTLRRDARSAATYSIHYVRARKL